MRIEDDRNIKKKIIEMSGFSKIIQQQKSMKNAVFVYPIVANE